MLRNDWIDSDVGGPVLSGQFVFKFGIPNPAHNEKRNTGIQRVRMTQLNLMVRFLNDVDPAKDISTALSFGLLGPKLSWGGPYLNKAVELSSQYVLQYLGRFHLQVSDNLTVVNSLLTGLVISRDYGKELSRQALEDAIERVDGWVSESGVGIRLALGSGILQGHPSGWDWTSSGGPKFSDDPAWYPPYFPGSTVRQDFSRHSVSVKYSVDGVSYDPEGFIQYFELKK